MTQKGSHMRDAKLTKLKVKEFSSHSFRFILPENSHIHCFGSDVSFAIEAWKTEIGRVPRAYK
jgi:hypothetical protein